MTPEHTLLVENKLKILEPYLGAKKHVRMLCLVCELEHTATPLAKRQALRKYGTTGCPHCNALNRDKKHSMSRESNLTKLASRGIEILDGEYDGRRHMINSTSYTKVRVRNTNCGHEFECSPTNLLMGEVECAVCGPQKRARTLTQWSKNNSSKWQETATEWQKYKSKVSVLSEQAYQQHRATINPNNYPRGIAGKEGAYHLDHIVSKRFCFDNNIPPEVCASHHNLQMMDWRANVSTRDHIKGNIPPFLLKYISSGTKLERYAQQLRNIFPGGETFYVMGDVVATLYHPSTNLAIFVILMDREYANQKSGIAAHRVARAHGITPIILFEDEMQDDNLLRAKLIHYSATSQVERIHARKCTIRQCTAHEKSRLLNANHVQGNDNSTIWYGAYYKDEMVAVMTFSNPRVGIGQHKVKKPTVFELVRFCTDVRYRIPGIASKLLTHFKQNHQWTEIYSYADKRWSVGNMYTQIGFTLSADNPPGYFYVVDGLRKHRWSYRKDAIKQKLPNYDPSKTEYENMVAHGFWRVWDCGTLRFTLKNA